jgi:hypothetical protein
MFGPPLPVGREVTSQARRFYDVVEQTSTFGRRPGPTRSQRSNMMWRKISGPHSGMKCCRVDPSTKAELPFRPRPDYGLGSKTERRRARRDSRHVVGAPLPTACASNTQAASLEPPRCRRGRMVFPAEAVAWEQVVRHDQKGASGMRSEIGRRHRPGVGWAD